MKYEKTPRVSISLRLELGGEEGEFVRDYFHWNLQPKWQMQV